MSVIVSFYSGTLHVRMRYTLLCCIINVYQPVNSKLKKRKKELSPNLINVNLQNTKIVSAKVTNFPVNYLYEICYFSHQHRYRDRYRGVYEFSTDCGQRYPN